MILHEGRCTNCGSILMLNKDQEKGHCLYCDAVFPTEEALKLAENADGYVFPNLPQEKYEGENLDPVITNTSFIPAASGKSKAASAATVSEKFVPSGEKVPDLNIPIKKKIIFIAATLAVLLLFAAIMIPLTTRRDRYRAEIKEKLDLKLSEAGSDQLEIGETIEFHGLSNSTVIMVLDTEMNQKEAEALYREYCKTRAEVMGMDVTDDTQSSRNVELRLATAGDSGGWIVDFTEENGVRSREFNVENADDDESETES